MGTNYYLHTPKCDHCGRSDEPLHIGKSSGGWCFSLHVIPGDGINSLEDWKVRWSAPGVTIKDEYGSTISPAEMLDTITNRSWPDGRSMSDWDLERNHAVRGPNGLLRHRVDSDGRYCIGHGNGTWDLCPGWFS